MNGSTSLSLVIFILHLIAAIAEEGCILNVQKDLHSKSPILLNEKLQIIIPPTNTGIILLNKSQPITLACLGDTNLFKTPERPRIVKLIEGFCVNGTTFNLGAEINIQNVSCNRIPESVPKVVKNRCNGSNNTLAEIGFQIGETNFLKMIEICFDKAICRPVYTKHTLFPAINARQVTSGISFRNTETFLFENLGDRPANLLQCKAERASVLRILDSEDLTNKYISCNDTNREFANGHLSPNADFIFSYQQNATYYHANSAPQWQFFNNRNWKVLEERIRTHVQVENREFYVYTGNSEEATFLPDINNNNADIYLSPNRKLPAPLYYWKLFHDSATNSGIGFIGYNVHFNQTPPFFKPPDYESQCFDKLWFKESEITIERGLMYCVDVKSLLNITGFKDFTNDISTVIVFKSKNTQ